MQVDAGATLEWLPQETIVFNGAIYRQDLRVELAIGGSWLGWDITRFGRTAREKDFCRESGDRTLKFGSKDTPLWIDRQWLPGGAEIINSPHGLAGQSVVGSLVWLGQAVEPEIVAKSRALWEQNALGKPESLVSHLAYYVAIVAPIQQRCETGLRSCVAVTAIILFGTTCLLTQSLANLKE